MFNNNDQQTTRPKHFLDSISEEDTNIVDSSKVEAEKLDQEEDIEEEIEVEEDIENLSEEELEELELERQRLLEEQENQDDDSSQEQETEFSYAPFIQELVDGSLLSPIEEKEYDNSLEGFKEMVEDTIEIKFKEFKESVVNPVSAKFIEFLEAGGTPDEFIQKSSEIPDYANMKLDDDNTLKNIIADHLYTQGYDEEDINATLEEYEELGTLSKHGAIAQKYMVKYAEKELANLTKKQQEAEQERIEYLEKEAEQLRDSIYNKEDIAGFKLTKKERDNLYDYITKPVKKENGKIYTQNTLEDSTDIKVALAYFKMKNFNFKHLENKIETKKASELQLQLKRKADSLAGRSNQLEDQEISKSGIQGFDFLNRP